MTARTFTAKERLVVKERPKNVLLVTYDGKDALMPHGFRELRIEEKAHPGDLFTSCMGGLCWNPVHMMHPQWFEFLYIRRDV